MFDKEEEKKLFDLLERMIKVDRSQSLSDSPGIPRGPYIFSGFMAVMMLLAVYFECKSLAQMSYVVLILFWFFYVVWLTFELYRRALDRVKNFHSKMMCDFKADFREDKIFVEELRDLKKSTLEYALSQCKCQSISLDRRLSVSLAMFSIFIASVVFMIDPAKLGVEGKNAHLASICLFFIVCFIILFFNKMIALRKRLDQIIGLLECAIRLPSKAKNDAAPKSDSE